MHLKNIQLKTGLENKYTEHW